MLKLLHDAINKISKFTCNSCKDNLSCLTNSGLLQNCPKSRAIRAFFQSPSPSKGSKLPETLHTVEYYGGCCSWCLIIAWKLGHVLVWKTKLDEKKVSLSTQVLPFSFPPPTPSLTFFGFLQLSFLYVFSQALLTELRLFGYDLQVISPPPGGLTPFYYTYHESFVS